MSAKLSELKFVASKRPTQMPAVVVRRNKLINKIHEQIKLATAAREGSVYAPMRLRSMRNRDTGEMKRVEMPKRIRPWWFTAENGRVCVQIKYGTKTLDIGGKGKSSIEIANGDELIKVLEVVKSAVEAGELDTHLESAGLKLKSGFGK